MREWLAHRRNRAFFIITREALNYDRVMQLLNSHKELPITSQKALHDLPMPLARLELFTDYVDVEGLANHLAMRHSHSPVPVEREESNYGSRRQADDFFFRDDQLQS